MNTGFESVLRILGSIGAALFEELQLSRSCLVYVSSNCDSDEIRGIKTAASVFDLAVDA